MAKSDVDIVTLRKAREGDDSAVKSLAAQFDGVIKAIARSCFIYGGDADDLYQIGLIGFYDAIRRYDPDRNDDFSRFAKICINSRLIDAIKEAGRKKHLPLNTAVDFDNVALQGGVDPEKALLLREELLRVYADIDVKLSDYEKLVLNYYIDGLSYKEIAVRTGKDVKSVSNAVARIRAKLI